MLERLNAALADRYAIERELGRGGMATVWLAHDLRHDRPVAIKVLRPELAAGLGPDRFLREIRLTARLEHPHILPLLDSGEADGLLYYVMPYVEGESLRERIAREKQLPVPDALRIAREVADALGCAHTHGIVHRDIKPENILLGGGHARVADFGIARAVAAAGDGTLTETGIAVGTPLYMSPEQASGMRDLDVRSDIYSLGCVLYEMLAGQPPYTGASAAAIQARKASEPAPGLRVVRETVPPAVERALARALARVPADRFASAEEFARALEGAEPIPVSRAGPRRRTMVVAALAAAAALVFAADVGDLRTRLLGRAAAPKIESLAVLPLENLSGDERHDWLAAGVHEALILDLGRLGGLRRVTARSSVLRYQGTSKTPRQIGQELGVDALVAGTVTLVGDRVRVTAHLIRASTEEQLWQEGYERDLRDALRLQAEIVAAIAREVELRLSPGERQGLAHSRRVDPRAYEAYLKGRFQLNKLTPDGFGRAMAHFREAIAIDSTEPLAYAGLAQGYTLLELVSPTTSAEDAQRAKAAAQRALALDESLAEAHVALSIVQASKEYDYEAADRSIRRALEVNPNGVDPHVHYAWHLATLGEGERAIAELRRAVELDPLSPLHTAWLGGMYWEYGRPDEAIAEAHKAMELQADFPVALFVLGLARLDQGRREEAIAAHQRALELYPGQGFSWALARTYALAGRPADARAILARLESGKPGDIVHPWFIAAAYVALGDRETALDWLERGYEQRIIFLANLGRERSSGAEFGALRGHPRFEALLRKVNLEKREK